VVTVDHTRGNQVALRWLLYDGYGNLVRLMAPDYTLSAFQWRGVWGEVQGSLGTGRGYCANLGHPEDETGLVYMRARYYEPATGRFISEDPSRDGVNWYAYCENQPNDRADSNGRIWHVIGAGVLGGILGGISSAVNGGSFWKGFIGGFIAGAGSVLLPGMLTAIAGALGAMVTAALEGQDWRGILKAGGLGFAVGLAGYLLRVAAAAEAIREGDKLVDELYWFLIGVNADLWSNNIITYSTYGP
jgi:RHS repeat-associated protein